MFLSSIMRRCHFSSITIIIRNCLVTFGDLPAARKTGFLMPNKWNNFVINMVKTGELKRVSTESITSIHSSFYLATKQIRPASSMSLHLV